MLPRVLKTPTPVTIGVPVHHRANSRCAILLIFKRFGKPFFAKKHNKSTRRGEVRMTIYEVRSQLVRLTATGGLPCGSQNKHCYLNAYCRKYSCNLCKALQHCATSARLSP